MKTVNRKTTLDPAATMPKQDGPTPRMSRLSSPKVNDQHLTRLALVYVRQSTAQQVFENRESLDRQYALSDYATALGWNPTRILTIDDDLG